MAHSDSYFRELPILDGYNIAYSAEGTEYSVRELRVAGRASIRPKPVDHEARLWNLRQAY